MSLCSHYCCRFMCIFSASGCSEHISFLTYSTHQLSLSQLLSGHLYVMRSHLLVPFEFFCFGQSSHNHQCHLVINYSCLFKRIRTEWIKKVWSLVCLWQHEHVSVLLWFMAPEVRSVKSTSSTDIVHFMWLVDTFFHFSFSDYLVGQNILQKQCILLFCCVLGFFTWLTVTALIQASFRISAKECMVLYKA